MKKKNILSILFLIGFTILGIIFLKGRTHELSRILEVNLKYVAILFFLAVIQSAFRGHRFKLMMDFYDLKAGFKELWGLEIVGQSWNYLTPFKGGLSAKAIYLKKKYKLPFTFFASATGISYLTDFLGLGILGVVASFFLPVSNEVKYSLITFFSIIILSTIFVFFFLPPIKTKIKGLKYVAKGVNEVRRVRKNYLFLLKMLLNLFIRSSMTITRLYVGFLAFGLQLPFHVCIIMGVFSGISKVIAITPMNLGFKESVIIVSSKLLNVNGLLGAFVAALDRAVSLIWTFIAAPIVGYVLLKNFKLKKE